MDSNKNIKHYPAELVFKNRAGAGVPIKTGTPSGLVHCCTAVQWPETLLWHTTSSSNKSRKHYLLTAKGPIILKKYSKSVVK